MEQNNKFFVYDSYVFAFKNALANVRIFTLAYFTWFVALLPLAIVGLIMNRALLALLPMAGANLKQLIVTHLLQTSGMMILTTVLIFLLLLSWISVGFVRIGLRIHDTGEANISTLFPSPLLVLKIFIGMIMILCIAFIGFILFIVPGVYFCIRAWFYMYALVEGEGIFEALSTSFRITRGKGWQIFPLLIMSSIIAAITIFFGSFICVLSNAYAYRLLKKDA